MKAHELVVFGNDSTQFWNIKWLDPYPKLAFHPVPPLQTEPTFCHRMRVDFPEAGTSVALVFLSTAGHRSKRSQFSCHSCPSMPRAMLHMCQWYNNMIQFHTPRPTISLRFQLVYTYLHCIRSTWQKRMLSICPTYHQTIALEKFNIDTGKMHRL